MPGGIAIGAKRQNLPIRKPPSAAFTSVSRAVANWAPSAADKCGDVLTGK
jgi:hypothetical protein